MSVYAQPAEQSFVSTAPSTAVQCMGLFSDPSYPIAYYSDIDQTSYQQQDIEANSHPQPATYWENDQPYIAQPYFSGMAAYDETSAAVFQEPVESGSTYHNLYDGHSL